MFEHTSRYYHIEDRVYHSAEGHEVVYKARRLIPKDQAGPIINEIATVSGERPDLLANRAMQQPELFWRLCDSDEVMNPFELTARTGRRVRVRMPMPGV